MKYLVFSLLLGLFVLGATYPAKSQIKPKIQTLPLLVKCISTQEFVDTVVKNSGIKILSHKKVSNDEYIVVYVGPENLRFVVARYNTSKDRICIKEMEEGMDFNWKKLPGELQKLTGIRTYTV